MSSDRPTKTVKYSVTTLCTTDQQIPTSNKNSKENDIFGGNKSQFYIQTIWCNEVLIAFIQLFFDHCYSIG